MGAEIVGIVMLALIGLVVYKLSERSQEPGAERNASTNNGNAFKIMKESLKKLGCKPEEVDENEISFAYQGENFIVRCQGVYARIWDPAWAGLKADDPNVNILASAVNKANCSIFPTVIALSDDDNSIMLHSRMDIMLVPSIPQVEEYVKSVLGSFFSAKDAVRAEFHNFASTEQQKQQKKRKKMGFYLPDDDE